MYFDFPDRTILLMLSSVEKTYTHISLKPIITILFAPLVKRYIVEGIMEI